MGRAEIVELVRMYPDFLVQAVDGYLDASGNEHRIREALENLDVTIRLAQGRAQVSLEDLPFVREALLAGYPAAQGRSSPARAEPTVSPSRTRSSAGLARRSATPSRRSTP